MSTSSNLGKSLFVPASVSTTQPTASLQAVPAASFDSSRRQNNSASHQQAASRKGQASRKQHRQRRLAGLPRDLGRSDEDKMAEIRALRNPSSRRGQTSITHLMSYAAPPRPQWDGSHSRSYRRNPTWGSGSGYHAQDKARYVHANYRFVVSPVGAFAKAATDADEHLDWADVLQVIASAESQQTSCPICLSEPVAPRMAKCGHMFCLPCLIRYMNTSIGEEETRPRRWRKCPICEDSVVLSDVRPVRLYAGQESPLPRPGDDVILRLMMRNAKSTLALPREGGADVLAAGDVPWHFAASVLDYARVMKGTGEYMVEQYDGEVEELLKREKEDELLFEEDKEWTQKAIRSVHAAKEKVQGLGREEVALSSRAAAGASQSRHREMDFYFYACPPHLYLSPLDIRILKTMYGTFSALPSTLLPRVEHISTGHVVDEVLRKRAKYLGHLPQGCLISFLECDWTDIVSGEVLATFSEDIERRRKRNRDKAAQEEGERVHAERIEAAKMRGSRRNLGTLQEEVTLRFGSLSEDGPVNLDDFVPLGVAGTRPPDPRPGFDSLSQISTSPLTGRTVWGTTAIPTPVSPGVEPESPQTVADGWLRDDDVLQTLGAADMALQMEAMGLGAHNPGPSHGGPTDGDGNGTSARAAVGGKKNKKKKKQKITLMSTGGRRGL